MSLQHIVPWVRECVLKLVKFQYLRFLAVGACGSLLAAGILYSLTEWFNVYYMFSYVAAAISGSIVNYLLNRKFVFNK